MTESAASLALKAESRPALLKDIYPERSRGASPPSAPAARDWVQLTQGAVRRVRRDPERTARHAVVRSRR